MKGYPMIGTNRLHSPLAFSEILFQRMIPINAGIRKLAFYEFRYALENLYPKEGWDSIVIEKQNIIERAISSRKFFESILLKPIEKDRIVLDKTITKLTRMLFAGLVNGEYSAAWVNKFFYFDIRGFIFLPRTVYFTEAGVTHLGSKPHRCFKPQQTRFDTEQEIGYLEFAEANKEIDQAFIELIKQLIEIRGTPTLITLAGPTAAGKTEITERLLGVFGHLGQRTTTIEMDNFLLDREFRDGKPMGQGTIHFELFKQSLQDILHGEKITIPCYDTILATSSHDLEGNLIPGCTPLQVEPADIIFLEGNFPFHIQEISNLIGINVVYLTDDPIRLKRKWRRDVDYRKSIDPAHFRNRFFATQFMRAEDVYRPQIEHCDIVVDTSAAEIWMTPEVARQLDKK